MTKAIYYPKADRRSQWYGPGNFIMPSIEKVLWHSTETAGGWPGYAGGGAAPTLTYDPWKHAWRQHFQLNGSARALVDSAATAVRENRDNVVQIEISAYIDPGFGAKYGHNLRKVDNQAINDLAEFSVFMNTEWGVPYTLASPWLDYPASAGNSQARMSGPEYDRFRGHLGHQHASSNAHGDPGAPALFAEVIRRAKGMPNTPGTGAGGAGGTPQPEKDGFDMATPKDVYDQLVAALTKAEIVEAPTGAKEKRWTLTRSILGIRSQVDELEPLVRRNGDVAKQAAASAADLQKRMAALEATLSKGTK